MYSAMAILPDREEADEDNDDTGNARHVAWGYWRYHF